MQDPQWTRNETGRYYRLVHLDPEAQGLSGIGGVYLVWHGGVRPRWVYAGASDDLAVALHGLGSFSDVMLYEVNGGLFVTWSRVRREFRQGVLAYLIRSLRPLVRNRHTPADDVKPVKVAVPSDIGASGPCDEE